ncbi:MAG: arsenite methyltransferase [Anaerolineae bacterium]
MQDGCGNAEGAYSSSSCRTQGTSDVACCGADIGLLDKDSVQFITDYSPAELATLPPEVETIAFGCGNPVALANLRPGETVPDSGSGGGVDVLLAARQVGPHGKVIGVDMTLAMTERATRAAVQAGVNNVEFRRGQAEALPVADASVDVVLSNCVINLCEDKGGVFSDAFRVLKPGGRLEISDMVTAGPLPLALRYDPSGWSGCISGALPEQEYLDLVAEAGFEAITAQRSHSAGVIGNVPAYGIILAARKPST